MQSICVCMGSKACPTPPPVFPSHSWKLMWDIETWEVGGGTQSKSKIKNGNFWCWPNNFSRCCILWWWDSPLKTPPQYVIFERMFIHIFGLVNEEWMSKVVHSRYDCMTMGCWFMMSGEKIIWDIKNNPPLKLTRPLFGHKMKRKITNSNFFFILIIALLSIWHAL